MRCRIFSLLLLATLLSTAASAETIEIPLPALHGHYPTAGIWERTVSFIISPPPVAIFDASFRVSGTLGSGMAECDGGDTYPWPISIGVLLDDPDAGWWSGGLQGPEEAGAVSETFPIDPSLSDPPGWAFLLDGEGELTFYAAPNPLVGLCWPITPDPEADITEAVLILEVELPVSSSASSWSKVKSLYRRSR